MGWNVVTFGPQDENRRVTLEHKTDESSAFFKGLSLHGTVIDKAIIEIAKADGGSVSSVLARTTFERVVIYDVQKSASDSSMELIVLDIGKMTAKRLSSSPDVMTRAGLDPTLGVRNAARLA